MSGIQLSGALIDDIKARLVENDAACSDDMVAVQYMAAVLGYALGEADLNIDKKDAVEQLSAFTMHVMEQVEGDKQKQQAAQEPMGVWKPE